MYVYVVFVYMHVTIINKYLLNLNFQSLEVVSRYRDTQLQVTENVCDL